MAPSWGIWPGAGVVAAGVDRSMVALRTARDLQPAVRFVRADVRRLPFRDGGFDMALDRGCFHYLSPADRPGYAAEVARVLRPGGRLLLRACMYAQGVRNDLTEPVVREVFAGWRVAAMEQTAIPTDTRQMIAIVARLERPVTGA